MQSRLIALGYSCGALGADGVFGKDTQTAVIYFQRFNGLIADGIYGPKTHAVLVSGNAVSYSLGLGGYNPGGSSYTFNGNVEEAIDKMIAAGVREQGNNYKKGTSKYGIWYGMQDAEWCNCFISWCADQGGILDILVPKYAYTEDTRVWYQKRNAWRTRGMYTPKKGDVIFFKYYSGRTVTHVGLVTENSNGSTVRTIEGNLTMSGTSDYKEVRLCTHSLSDTDIVAFGVVRDVAASLPQYPNQPQPKVYCGGSDYKNLKHHNNGVLAPVSLHTYECGTCGYRVNAPHMEDRRIVLDEAGNTQAHIKMQALFYGYNFMKKLRDARQWGGVGYPKEYYAPERCLYLIDQMRKSFPNKYAYNIDGVCKEEYKPYWSHIPTNALALTGEDKTYYMPDLVTGTISSANLTEHNGVNEVLVSVVSGLLVPAEYQLIFGYHQFEQEPTAGNFIDFLKDALGIDEKIGAIMTIIQMLTDYEEKYDPTIHVGDYFVCITNRALYSPGNFQQVNLYVYFDKTTKRFKGMRFVPSSR